VSFSSTGEAHELQDALVQSHVLDLRRRLATTLGGFLQAARQQHVDYPEFQIACTIVSDDLRRTFRVSRRAIARRTR
jgi:hypothetical protein